MSLVVELFGGPGIGKTTFAAKLFAAIKDDRTYTVELVQEYVKTWAWEKRDIGVPEQIYLTAKQMRNESRLYGKVDIIVTDAPVVLGAYYSSVYLNPTVSEPLLQLYKSVEWDHNGGYLAAPSKRLRVFLNRVKPYDPRGRFQDEAEARDVDYDLRRFLQDNALSYIDVPATTEETVKIVLARAAALK